MPTVLLGNQPDGRTGGWVAQPGYEVLGIDDFHCQFSANFAHLRFVGAGQAQIAPTDVNGGERTTSVYFDKTYSSPLPFVVAMAMASSWTLGVKRNSHGGLATSYSRGQYPYLNGLWITPVRENCGFSGVYGIDGNFIGHSGAADVNVPGSWASIKFEIRLFGERVEFAANNTFQTVYVKYLIFDPTI